MHRLSVVIPSKSMPNIVPCLGAINEYDPSVNMIVVDDGIAYPNKELRMVIEGHCAVIPGEQPFVFARNVNLGIRAAGDDDVIVMNDDALLTTYGGFTAMQKWASEHLEYGLISAASNNVGNMNMWPRGTGTVRREERMVCFVCVLIPRRTIDAVGLLDERFVGYGLDDDDYCLRVRQAGLIIGIHDGCVVDHSKLKSSFRAPDASNNAPGDFRPNMKLFIEKHGRDNWGRQKEQSEFKELWTQ